MLAEQICHCPNPSKKRLTFQGRLTHVLAQASAALRLAAPPKTGINIMNSRTAFRGPKEFRAVPSAIAED